MLWKTDSNSIRLTNTTAFRNRCEWHTIDRTGVEQRIADRYHCDHYRRRRRNVVIVRLQSASDQDRHVTIELRVPAATRRRR